MKESQHLIREVTVILTYAKICTADKAFEFRKTNVSASCPRAHSFWARGWKATIWQYWVCGGERIFYIISPNFSFCESVKALGTSLDRDQGSPTSIEVWSRTPVSSRHSWRHIAKFLPPKWLNHVGHLPRRRPFQPVDKILVEQFSLKITFNLPHLSPTQAAFCKARPLSFYQTILKIVFDTWMNTSL